MTCYVQTLEALRLVQDRIKGFRYGSEDLGEALRSLTGHGTRVTQEVEMDAFRVEMPDGMWLRMGAV